MTWGNILLLFGSFVGILIALSGVAKARSQPANYFLVAFLFVCAFGIVLKLVDHTNSILAYPHLSRLNQPIGLLRPPLFFLFIFYSVNGSKIKRTSLLHLLPAALVILYLSPYLVLDGDTKVRIMNGEQASAFGIIPRWFPLFGLIYSATYLVLSYLQYRKASAMNPEMKRWLMLLLIGYAVFMITAVSIFVIDQTQTTSYIIYQVLSLLMIAACVWMLQLPINKRQAPKYAKSAISDEKKDKYLQAIHARMNEDELFTNEGFRMQDLAKSLQLSENVVSQVINEKLGLSFPDFVSQLRVEKAKKLLVDPGYAHYTLESIGMEAGFSSRASFYTAFKKFATTTPGEYQKRPLQAPAIRA